MTVEEELKKLIIEKGGDLTNFAKSIGITESTIRNAFNRESGIGGLSARKLFLICEALNINMRDLLAHGDIKEQLTYTPGFTQKEMALINQYRTLDNFGVDAVDRVVEIEYNRNKYYDNIINYLYRPVAPMSAAAGLGDLIDPNETDYETIKIPRTPESEASDFIVKISGNSMEPTYPDKSLLLVRIQPSIDPGQVGLFVYQGDAFVKIWNGVAMESINPEYPPIEIHDWDRFQTVGKICGITKKAN